VKFGDILKAIEGEVEKISRTFQYAGNQFISLGFGPGENDAETRERLEKNKEEAQTADLCIRCFDNSDGRKKINVRGIKFCPLCGSKNPNWKEGE